MYGEGKKKWDKYVGEFHNGMFHGNGSYYSNDGSRYIIGENNQVMVKYYFRYEGEFSSGLKNGKGVMYYRSGDTREGTWVKDKLIGR